MALAFVSGALIAALAFDLYAKAYRSGGPWYSALGFIAGAAVFIVIDALLERWAAGGEEGATGWGLVASVTLDGVPENIALGIALLSESGGEALTLLVAIFASNLPEALGGAVDMRAHGHSRTFAIGAWTATGVALALAVVAGNAAFAGLPPPVLAVMLSFAGGAVLASLADTIMPGAYEQGGPFVAFATAAGFLLSALISQG